MWSSYEYNACYQKNSIFFESDINLIFLLATLDIDESTVCVKGCFMFMLYTALNFRKLTNV